MSNYYALEVMKRDAKGSAAARRLRREGKIPAVFYSHGKENLNLAVNAKDFYTALHTGQHIFETKLDGKRQFLMVKEVQYHPVTDQIIHVDLMGVKMTERVTITVPLELQGESIGVKQGGVLMQNLTMAEVNCLPTHVPDKIEVDVSELEINQHIAAGDIELPEGVEMVTPADVTVVTVQSTRVAEEPEPTEEVEIEGQPAEEAPAEPEGESAAD
jgi:large subunit ribosomal protein L25